MKLDMWGEFRLDKKTGIRHLSLGDLHMWLQRKDDEIWIGHRYDAHDQDQAETKDSPPDDLEWARWAPKNADEKIRLIPVFSDLPVVIQSDYPLRVTPGSSIHIYTRIPLWIRVAIGKKEAVLMELPSVKLSRTWFGSPMEGELCYWATTKARRSLSDVERKPFLANCPILITNKTEIDLNFEKFCFRVERLKIFLFKKELWADETRILYHGEEQNSDVTMSGKLPGEMESGKLLSGPRKPIQRSLATRTFRKIFDDSFLFGQ